MFHSTITTNLGYPAVDLPHQLDANVSLLLLSGNAVNRPLNLTGVKYFLADDSLYTRLQFFVLRAQQGSSSLFRILYTLQMNNISKPNSSVKTVEFASHVPISPGDVFAIGKDNASQRFPVPYTEQTDDIAHPTEVHDVLMLQNLKDKSQEGRILNTSNYHAVEHKTMALAFLATLSHMHQGFLHLKYIFFFEM